jgi:hypothetical protein
MKDFSKARKPIEFEIDGDRFDCVPAIPAQTMMDMTAEFSAMDDNDPTQAIKAMMTVLGQLLLPASFALFEQRMKSQEKPIEFPQVNEVIMWLFGEYGMRPTEQSSDSADGLQLPESGTTSMGNTPDVVSISPPSPQPSS